MLICLENLLKAIIVRVSINVDQNDLIIYLISYILQFDV